MGRLGGRKSMPIIKATTQKELDALVVKQSADKSIEIEVRSPAGVWLEISGSSQVTAYGSSQVTAYGSSQVTAYGSSQVTAYGSSQVTASKQVAVTLSGNAKAAGGVQIKYKRPATTAEWLEEYQLTPKDGVVILFKAVNDEYKSSHEMSYTPGTMPIAPDWDGEERECGGGLHFCALPVMALGFFREATKFITCPVRVDEIVVHPNAEYPNKIKAPRVVEPGCYEVDINGKRK
jgi:hypothetical protein